MKKTKLGKIMGETIIKDEIEKIQEGEISDDFYNREERELELANDEIDSKHFWFMEGFDSAE